MTDPVIDATPAGAAALARGVTATWWYTALSIVIFYVFVLGVMGPAVLLGTGTSSDPVTIALFAVGAGLSCAGVVLLLRSYRRGVMTAGEAEPWWHISRSLLLPLAAAVVGGVLVGVGSGSLLFGAGAVGLALSLPHWPAGVRLRLVLLIMIVVGAFWVVEGPRLNEQLPSGAVVTLGLFALMLPSIGATSLWWWDVVVTLDRARAAHSRLAAAQERLRLASDLHDLQGHHLQVIALQLELAERMLPRDPDAALEQVRLARTSVDEARRGTRELAGRFRGVPLPDELANAADLLRAAGLRVDLDVDVDADAAPADVLGPVVRELTTNVLKHGAGERARLALSRVDGAWALRVVNDADEEASPREEGSGLSGVADRVGAAGGAVRAARAAGEFEVVVTVPADSQGDAAGAGRAR